MKPPWWKLIYRYLIDTCLNTIHPHICSQFALLFIDVYIQLLINEDHTLRNYPWKGFEHKDTCSLFLLNKGHWWKVVVCVTFKIIYVCIYVYIYISVLLKTHTHTHTHTWLLSLHFAVCIKDRQKGERKCENEGIYQSDMATSQGMPVAIRY